MSEVIVLFEVKPTEEGTKRYLELAGQLKGLLAGFEGFVRAERFESLAEKGKLLSLNVWTSEEAVARWRSAVEHRLCQREGRDALFESYRITVCSTIRSYTDDARDEAPEDSNRCLLGDQR